jgi:hypothetical protein
MKKAISATVGVLVVVALALAIIPTTRDDIHWHWASHKDATASYEAYVKTWPAGRHATEAKARYDEHGWADAQAANTVQEFERYVQLHADGKHVADAKDSIESLHWQEATAANTIKAYQDYGTALPQGRHLREAQTKAAALRTADAPYETAMKAGTEASLRRFLEDFPGHQREADAQQAIKDITEGRDIVDLLKEKKIEVQATGSGIEQVSVRIRKLVPYSLTVRIPVGSFFVSANSSAQNMVTTAESRIRLTSNEWTSASPDAACANRPRDIPGGDDTFTVQRSPNQAELARLMPVLDKARVDTETRQAAVWIVTDNADFSDLGILVASQFGFGGSRVINEQETARAMKICDEAGIDITRKAIWRDRQKIISGLEDAELKAWLEQKK